jgi:carboxyl-terminal processing protease
VEPNEGVDAFPKLELVMTRTPVRRWLAVALLAVWFFGAVASATENPYRALKLFGDVLELVRKRYVEGVSRDSLTMSALRGLLDNLDSYSLYLEDLKYRQNLRPGPLSFPRFGLCLGLRAGRLMIVAPLPGSAAEVRGLSPGDRIHELGDQTTAGMSPREVLSGLADSSRAELLITRRGLARPLNVEVTAERWSPKPFGTMVRDSVGYLRPGWIVEGTGASTLDALTKLRGRGVRALILDLRMSPGEELQEAATIAGAFLAGGLTVGYVAARDDSNRTFYRTESDGALIHVPLAALVGPGTCCAGELLAASLKAHHRAVLVGTETFGKGTVQKTLPLTPSTGVALTYARWYTPEGWCVDREVGGWDPLHDEDPQVVAGVSPHIAVPPDTLEVLEAALRFSGVFSVDDARRPPAELLAERGFLFLPTQEAVDSVLALPGGVGRPVFLADQRETAIARVTEERARRDGGIPTGMRLAQDATLREALAVLLDSDRYESLRTGEAIPASEGASEAGHPSTEPRNMPAGGP